MTPTVEEAGTTDPESVRRLLEDAELPTDGLEDHFPQGYVVARVGTDVVAAAGLEQYREHGLLRSVAVVTSLRGRGLGRTMVASRLAAARKANLRTVYLLASGAKRSKGGPMIRPLSRGLLPLLARRDSTRPAS